MKKTILTLSVCVILSACGFLKSVPAVDPTIADAERVQAKFPGTKLDDLQLGKISYEENCGKCHGLKRVNSRTEDEWRAVVPRMSKKAKIDALTEKKILTYLVTMCEVPKK